MATQKRMADGTTAQQIVGTATAVDGSPATPVIQESKPNREFIDANADGNTYYGSAPYGSALADAVWTIERANATKTVFMFAP